MNSRNRFSQFIQAAKQTNILVLQPRMGFGTRNAMRAGLLSVRDVSAKVVGTITLDSYTRINDYEAARKALIEGHALNGYPIVTYTKEETMNMLEGVMSHHFPIQVRHGTPLPKTIFEAISAVGIDATEGGPVSYCLPYGRVPLQQSIREWAECCEYFSKKTNGSGHIESFAGCMLGQLCPSSLLIALSILEGLFFLKHGVKSISLSFVQGTHSQQDLAGLHVLDRLIQAYLPQFDVHIVMYTYMGIYPQTLAGANRILEESAKVAQLGGAQRLIVKTAAEAHHLPTIEVNIEALQFAHAAAEAAKMTEKMMLDDEMVDSIDKEARLLIDAVLDLSSDLDQALFLAFSKGYLDLPYCLHPDNKNQSRSYIDQNGRLQWASTGKMPFRKNTRVLEAGCSVTADKLLEMLHYNRNKYDHWSVN